jgi:hypothetical protein
MGQADLKERWRHPKKKSRTNLTLTLDTAVLRRAIISSTASPRESTLQQASERKLGNNYFLVLRYMIAALESDNDEMDRVMALAKGNRGADHAMAHAEALALVRSGRLQAARRSSSRAVDLALQEEESDSAASYRAARAVWEAVCGNAAEGRRNAVAALELSTGRDVEYAAGLALGLSGDSPRSEALANDLERRFPEDTFARFTYVPVLRALAAMGRGKPADGISVSGDGSLSAHIGRDDRESSETRPPPLVGSFRLGLVSTAWSGWKSPVSMSWR